MAIVEVSITPIGTESPSISRYVAKCEKVLHDFPGVEYQLTPMGTVIEGDLRSIFEVITLMHEVPFDNGAARVSTLIKVDDRRDKEATMDGKVQSVRKKL